MAIKSLSELLVLQNALKDKINLRETGQSTEGITEILVGMATCGIASGAKATYEELCSLIAEKKLQKVNVISVGCMGYCSMEPTLQVCIPGKEPIVYGKITKDKARELLEKVIEQGGYLPDNVVIRSFHKVGA